jgi:hypothetical protein
MLNEMGRRVEKSIFLFMRMRSIAPSQISIEDEEHGLILYAFVKMQKNELRKLMSEMGYRKWRTKKRPHLTHAHAVA